ncbi:MAG: GNAT family N-acetyltransferase [Streptococcaceae bacterium]|jgi:N-acetylglutamate synthase-like GNAT family acetyltransferase|nr:GNAT family N-acetyltransferase [Streptococcaceae bacterium]
MPDKMEEILVLIRKARIEETQEITDVLNVVTQDLLRKNIHQWTQPWNESEIIAEINQEQLYVLENENKILGTFAIKEKSCLSSLDLTNGSYYLYQIAILPICQGNGLGGEILKFAERHFEKVYLDCWAGNAKLKDFYSQNGWDYLGDFPENDYFISVFMNER